MQLLLLLLHRLIHALPALPQPGQAADDPALKQQRDAGLARLGKLVGGVGRLGCVCLGGGGWRGGGAGVWGPTPPAEQAVMCGQTGGGGASG